MDREGSAGGFREIPNDKGGYRVENVSDSLRPLPEVSWKQTMATVGLAIADTGLFASSVAFREQFVLSVAAVEGFVESVTGTPLPPPEIVATCLAGLLALVGTGLLVLGRHQIQVANENSRRDLEAGRE